MNDLNIKQVFFREIMVYRPILMRALAGVLGEMETENVFRRLEALEASGAFVEDPEAMRRLGGIFVGKEEDLGFYVLTILDKGAQIHVKEDGRIQPANLRLETRPVFLYWDEAIKHCASRLSAYELPVYFTPWLHEFCHFLCYCLQDRPMMAATSLLTSALGRRGVPIKSLQDLTATRENGPDSFEWKLGVSLAQLAGINESLAVWWEVQLLRGMEFDLGNYLEVKVDKSLNARQLLDWGSEKTLAYIRNWDRAGYYQEPFTRAFVDSFRNITFPDGHFKIPHLWPPQNPPPVKEFV